MRADGSEFARRPNTGRTLTGDMLARRIFFAKRPRYRVRRGFSDNARLEAWRACLPRDKVDKMR